MCVHLGSNINIFINYKHIQLKSDHFESIFSIEIIHIRFLVHKKGAYLIYMGGKKQKRLKKPKALSKIDKPGEEKAAEKNIQPKAG